MVCFWIVLFVTELLLEFRDNGTRKLLLQEQELTLTRCIDICKLQAMSNQEDRKFFLDGKSKGKTSENMNSNDKGLSTVIACKFWGKWHTKRQQDCPAWGESCIKYGEKNHFGVKCFKHSSGKTAAKSSKQRNLEQLVHGLSEDSFSQDYLLPVSSRVIGATLNALSMRDYKRGYDDPQLKEHYNRTN